MTDGRVTGLRRRGDSAAILAMDILARLGDIALVRATAAHLAAIERLLADDPTSPDHVATTTLIGDNILGETPEGADLDAAFGHIDSDPNQLLAVALDSDSTVIGTFQLTFLTTLARGGGTRVIVTGARFRSGPDAVAQARETFAWIARYAAERGARAIAVSTERDRAHIHGFYTTLGFRYTHDGLSLPL